jgi:hypothetical protein
MPELVLIDGMQQVAMKRDESPSPYIHLSFASFALCRHSPPLVLRFYDSAIEIGWIAETSPVSATCETFDFRISVRKPTHSG